MKNIKLYCGSDYKEMSRKAARVIQAQITLKPDSVLGLATGSSPVGLYEFLVEWYKNGELDFSRVKSINLDEYQGLAPDNDQSYRYFMQKNLFSHVNIDAKNTYLPNGLAKNVEDECKRYDAVSESLGITDLQLLGIGLNGHIGFNEPADDFPLTTHLAPLAEKTINTNKRFFKPGEEVPKTAYTLGLGTIMKAKTILLIASGKEKAGILKEALFGPVTPKVPGSILQLHKNLIVVGDKDVLSMFPSA
jgi:glucosamine-6-phosphate deaminase